MQQRKSDYWCVGTLRTIVFFMVALLVFSAVRLFFFLYYRAEQSFFSEWPALVLGARLDAKWFAILLLPAWITWLLGLWRAAFLSVARWLAVTALAVFILLGLINIGFYGFYVTPISSLIFGFLQDDTQAILITLWRNWPIVTYVAAWCLLTLIPCLAYRFCRPSFSLRRPGLISAITAVILTLFIAVMCRGSFGTFPLRQQDLLVGPDPFVNASVQNGVAAFFEANKSRKMLELKGGVLAGLKSYGFKSPDETLAQLAAVRPQISDSVPPPRQPTSCRCRADGRDGTHGIRNRFSDKRHAGTPSVRIKRCLRL